MANYWLGDNDTVKRLCREIIKEELSVRAWNNLNDTITIQLMLGEELIGKQLTLDVNWKTDHGHGGGSYITGLKAKFIKS